jgi:CIC family chloride channel protein
MLDAEGHYAGVIQTARAFAENQDPQTPVADIAIQKEASLAPAMAIKEIMAAFDTTQADELAVVDEDRNVLGVVSESYATRRYAEELEKARRDLTGES